MNTKDWKFKEIEKRLERIEDSIWALSQFIEEGSWREARETIKGILWPPNQ